MSISRRHFVASTGAALVASRLASEARTAPLPAALSPMGIADDLPNPPVLRSSNGLLDLSLVVAMGHTVLPEGPAHLRLYEGGIPAPTWVVRPGDRLRVHLQNTLPPNPEDADLIAQGIDPGSVHATHVHVAPNHPNTTNLHVHGFHVSPRAPSDDVFLEIKPGDSFQYSYDIPATHPTGTYWYHPHRHGSVAIQIASGMAGMIVMESPDGPPDMVERHMVVQSPMVGPDGVLDDPKQFMSLGGERYFLINGQYRPRIHMNAGEAQYWRILHANDSQFMPLDFTTIPGLDVMLLGRDGNPLAAPEKISAITLAPGNRVDLLVTATEVGIHDFGRQAFDQGLMNLPAAILGQLVVLKSEKSPQPAAAQRNNPSPPPIRDDEIVATKRFTLGTRANDAAVFGTAFTINGQPYDPDTFVTARLGTAEEWEFVNQTPFPHPIHIHVNPFQVMEIDGVPVPDRPWMDTIMVPPAGVVKIRSRFEDFDGEFVMHCHILPHEDAGMMLNIRIEK